MSDKVRERIWADSMTLPDEIEKWVVATLAVQEYCYTKKIPEKKTFQVGTRYLDLEKAFARMEVARRLKDDPRRYGWRRGNRFMRLAACVAGVILAANQFRKAIEEPEFQVKGLTTSEAESG